MKQQEEELKLLMRKIDSEIASFERLNVEVGAKREKVEKAVSAAGLQPVPIEIMPHSNESHNLGQEIKQHILELNKIKNFINSRLNVVIKEEELLVKLQQKYGKDIGIKKTGAGEFELTLSDKDTAAAFTELQKSKKMLSNVRQTVQSLTEEGEA